MKKFISKLYYKLDLIPSARYMMDILSWWYRYFTVKKVSKELLENIEWIKEMNIPIEWFYEKKPLWISWVARLKNWDDFLEEVIESYLSFVDEIILVDNLSTDKTKEICLKLQKKYPDKIKFYTYPYEVVPPWKENEKVSENSIHSLTYYYNWSFSKAKYKYVVKVDDDNLFIEEAWKRLREYVLTKQPKEYVVFWWVNLLAKGDVVWVSEKRKYLGKYWDHWIYPVSDRTYFIKIPVSEKFICPYRYKRMWFSLLHLKYLKKKFWLINNKKTELYKQFFSKIKDGKLLSIKDIFKTHKDIYIKEEDVYNTFYKYEKVSNWKTLL